jgi:hypothetical protein
MLLVRLLLITILATSNFACSHLIETDYPQYLSSNAGKANLPAVNSALEYSLTIDTQEHYDEFPAFMTAGTQVWIVEFGKMLDDTLQSAEVQNAFGTLEKTMSNDTDSDLLIFDLIEYAYGGSGAHISLDVSLFSEGKEVFTRNYMEDGLTQGSGLFLGTAFARKDAVQQATKAAMDKILLNLLDDVNAQKKNPVDVVISDR